MIMKGKKSLGQNFLTSRGVVRDIITAAQIDSDDIILEIGPGKGFLTEGILQKAKKVIVVEKDDRMVLYLKEKFSEEIKIGKLELIHGDILSFDPVVYKLQVAGYKLIANIPYYITGEILRMFLSQILQPSRMVLMVQKEVADRIVARDRKESILSMSVKVYGTPSYIQKVPARYFSPEPRVDSAVLLIENISKNNFKNKNDEDKFFEVVKHGFAHKRKMLLGNLKNTYEIENLEKSFEQCGISKKARAENISVDQWTCLRNYL